MQDQATSAKRIRPTTSLCRNLDRMLAYEEQYSRALEHGTDGDNEAAWWEDEALSALAEGKLAHALDFLGEAQQDAPRRAGHWQHRQRQIILVCTAQVTGATADDKLTGPAMAWYREWLLPYLGMEPCPSYLPAWMLSEAETQMIKSAIAAA